MLDAKRVLIQVGGVAIVAGTTPSNRHDGHVPNCVACGCAAGIVIRCRYLAARRRLPAARPSRTKPRSIASIASEKNSRNIVIATVALMSARW